MKRKGDCSSALREGCRSPSRSDLCVHRAAGTKVVQKRAQTAVPWFHVEHFLTSQPVQLRKWPAGLQHFILPCAKRAKSILEIWDLYFGPTAKLWRVHHTCTSSVTSNSSPGKYYSHQLPCMGRLLVSQRAVSEGWMKAALCLHCHNPVESCDKAYFLLPGARRLS